MAKVIFEAVLGELTRNRVARAAHAGTVWTAALYHKAVDGAYAAFGKVIEGMDIVNKIADVPTDFRDRPMKEQKIKSMTVDTFGVDYPEPKKA